jgi:hypothetical protein
MYDMTGKPRRGAGERHAVVAPFADSFPESLLETFLGFSSSPYILPFPLPPLLSFSSPLSRSPTSLLTDDLKRKMCQPS